jgi:hypothetical protein
MAAWRKLVNGSKCEAAGQVSVLPAILLARTRIAVPGMVVLAGRAAYTMER